MMKHPKIILCLMTVLVCHACSGAGKGAVAFDPGRPDPHVPAAADTARDSRVGLCVRNLERSIVLLEGVFDHYFVADRNGNPALARWYNPYTLKASSEKGSVWMYTSCMEAVLSVMKALKELAGCGQAQMYDRYWSMMSSHLSQLTDGLKYYQGTYTLTSYTQTRSWTVYAVNRTPDAGTADVTGVLNVYDDQEWLIRELLEGYFLTGEKKYLEKAEYLAGYVLDGWDTTLDGSGNEYGGITWGPGYNTKHACSNGPLVSPLVWLHNIYKGSPDTIGYRYIAPDGKRLERTMTKDEYYLMYAAKVYDFHKKSFINPDNGCYRDMLGAQGVTNQDGSTGTAYVWVDGVRYRDHNPHGALSGKAYTYNSGTMISGGADLYAATGDPAYLEDITALSEACFRKFATPSPVSAGCFSYPVDGFSVWFNDVLLRGWVDAAPYCPVESFVSSFQADLDYGYSAFLHSGMLPTDILSGWSRDDMEGNGIEALFTCAYSSEYATLAGYALKH